MIKNTKGNRMMNRLSSKHHESSRHPLPIRIMAILMAVVMVFSVVYINNSKGKVEAASSYKTFSGQSDNTLIVGDYNDENISVKVPAIGVKILLRNDKISTESNNVTYDIFEKRSDLESTPEINALPKYTTEITDANRDYYLQYSVNGVCTKETTWFDSTNNKLSLEGDYCYVTSSESVQTVYKKTLVTYDLKHGESPIPEEVKTFIENSNDGLDLDIHFEGTILNTVSVVAFETDVESLTISTNPSDKSISITDPDLANYTSDSGDIVTGQIVYNLYKDGESVLDSPFYGPEGFEKLIAKVNEKGDAYDGSYKIRKTIQPVISASGLSNDFVCEKEFTRDFYIGYTNEVRLYQDTHNGDDDGLTHTLNNANPNKDVTITFKPAEDDVNGGITTSSSGAQSPIFRIDDSEVSALANINSGQQVEITIPKKSENKGKTIIYTLTISNSATPKVEEKHTIRIVYDDDTPAFSDEKINDKAISTTAADISSGPALSTQITPHTSKDISSIERIRVFKANAAGEPDGDSIGDATIIPITDAETETTTYTASYSVSVDNLSYGNNSFIFVASTALGLQAESQLFKVNYEITPPVISQIEVTQKFNSVNTVAETFDAEACAADSVTLNSKLSCKGDASIQFTADDVTGGSGFDKIVYVDGATETIVTSNTYTIGANNDNNNTDKSYKFRAYDKAGNFKDITVNVSFCDDTITISDLKVISTDTSIGEYVLNTDKFITWKGSAVAEKSKRGFYLNYKVTVDKAALIRASGGAYIKYKIGATETSRVVTTDEYTYDGSGEKGVYTFNIPFDGTTKEITAIEFEFYNAHNASNKVGADIVRVDSTDPTYGPPELKTGTDYTGSEAAIISAGWYKKDLVLWFAPNDNDANNISSGLQSVNPIKGVDSISPIDENGRFFVIVAESQNSTDKTIVELELTDKAGNISYYNGTTTSNNNIFGVDGIKPETGLKITGVADGTYDGTLANLQNPPTISYKPSDTLSGVDSASVKATISDGVIETPLPLDEGPQPLSYYIEKGLKNTETTVYTVSVTVKDVVGNENTESKKFKVDGRPPVVTAKRSSNPTKGINYFYSSALAVDFSATDSNISNSGLKVTVKKDDEPETAVPVPFNISGPNSEGMSTAKGSYTFDEDGVYLVSFTATDDSGRNETKTVNFEIDTKEPDVVTKLNGEDYSLSDSYNTSVTTEIVATDKNLDNNDITTTIVRELPTGGSTTETKAGVGPFGLTEDGKYTVTYKVVDKAGNPTTKTIGFTVDNSKPVHNMYITTADPAKVARFNNTYSNAVGKFSGHSDQEEYTYGQYYNTDVSIDFSFFDYNIKSAQVTDNGSVLPVNWSFNGPYGKGSYTISSEGYHEIVFSSTDHSDNTTTDSGANQKLRFTIDKSAPTISTSLNGVRYSEGSGVRYFNTNGTIDVSVSDANIDGSDLNRINRMTVPGSSVSVSEASVGEGAETFSTEADYEVQYYAIDRAGNRSDTRTVMFRVDKTAPQLQVSNVGAVSTAGSQNVSFNVKEAFFSDMNNVTIKIYKRVEGRAEVLEKTIDFKPNSANDSTSYTFSEDAEYRIEFTAEDKCGNKSNTDYSFIKDGTAPLITLSGVSNYDKTDKNVELTVIIDEAFYSSNRVTLSGTRTDINGKSNAITFDSFVTNRSKISQLQQLFKEDGIYDITVTSTDKAGNSSSKGVHFTIDTTDPVIGDLSKYDGIRTNSFKWDTNLDDLVTDLTVCDIKVYMDGSLYDGTSDVEDGSHVLKIEATDELGHTTTKEVTFVIDSRGPNIIISNVEDGDNLLDSTEVIVTVELDEDSLDTVMLNDKAVEVKDNQAKLTVNKKGKYTLSATAHDEAGNASSAEIKFTFGKQTNLLLIGIIAGILILLLLALLVVIKRRQKDQ